MSTLFGDTTNGTSGWYSHIVPALPQVIMISCVITQRLMDFV